MSQNLVFNFYDSSKNKFSSGDLHSQLNIKSPYFLILVESDKKRDVLEKSQMKILEALDSEELNLFVISSSTMEENKNGYHTSIKTAQNLKGKQSGFRVRILSESGKILLSSATPLSTEKIKEVLKNKKL